MRAGVPPLAYVRHPAREQAPYPQEPFQVRTLPDGTPWTLFFRAEPDYVVRFPGLADFRIDADGSRVEAYPAPGTGEITLEHLYLNQALPLALGRQGKLVLHASAVATAWGCIAFIGDSGRGKSTLAASFASAGHPFLSDDGLCVEAGRQAAVAFPSHPSIRLWEDSEAAVAAPGPLRAPAVSYTGKARILAGPGFQHCGEPRVLRAVFHLGPGVADRIQVAPVRQSAAIPQLVRHSFLLDITHQEQLARHFADVAEIAAAVPHFDLDYPRRYDELAQVRAAILGGLAERAAS